LRGVGWLLDLPNQAHQARQGAFGAFPQQRGNATAGPAAIMTVIIDASVAVQWILSGENLGADAAELLARYERRQIAFAAPDVFWAEAANVLWNQRDSGDKRVPRPDVA